MHIKRTFGISASEIKGSIVIFCAGCMMFATDHMNAAAAKMDEAVGGTPYIGIHTFGEQGRFPDGSNRHGNLMFAAVCFTSNRRYMRLLNMDTATKIDENTPGFREAYSNYMLQ